MSNAAESTNATAPPAVILRVVLLCGLPGSGKSHLARQLLQQDPATRIIIEYDNLQTDATSIAAWHAARTKAMDELDRYLQQREENRTILLDDNFHLKSMRKQVYLHLWDRHQQLLPERTTILFGTIVLHYVPLEVCLQRNAARSAASRVPDDVIHRMQATFDVPSVSNYWEQSVLSLSYEETAKDQNWMPRIESFLATGLQPMVAPPQPTTATTTAPIDPLTLRQQADLFLRQVVKAVAVTSKRKAATANAVRQSLLRLSTGEPSENDEWVELFLAGDWLTQQEKQAVRDRLLSTEK